MKRMFACTLALACTAILTAKAGDAKEFFNKECAKCHGQDGRGQTKIGQRMGVKDFTDAKLQTAMKDDEMAKTIEEGRKDKEGEMKMKALGETVSDADIKSLVQYVRAFKK